MREFAGHARSGGRVYLTGGASAVLYGWRDSTVDVDIKLDPEPQGSFEAIARIKNMLNMNVELAAPDEFIPPLPGWRERSVYIGSGYTRDGKVEFYHYDFHAQALAKIERGHRQDLRDVEAMRERKLIEPSRLTEHFDAIEADLVRYPAIDPGGFRGRVEAAVARLMAVEDRADDLGR